MTEGSEWRAQLRAYLALHTQPGPHPEPEIIINRIRRAADGPSLSQIKAFLQELQEEHDNG